MKGIKILLMATTMFMSIGFATQETEATPVGSDSAIQENRTTKTSQTTGIWHITNITRNNVNYRKGPGESYDSAGQLNSGNRVYVEIRNTSASGTPNVVYYNSSWVKIRTVGKNGGYSYVHKSFVNLK